MTPPVETRVSAVGLRVVCAAALLLAVPFPGWGQSTLSRSPDIGGTWTSRLGVLHFHFVHRFQVTDPPVRKVLNSPTFLLAAGLPAGIVLGSRYATNSVLVAGEPNEWEAFARISPFQADHGRPFDLGIQGGYNGTARSLDAQVLMGRDAGPLRILAGGRAFSAFAGEEGEVAVTGGLVLRLRPYVALAGDVANLVTADSADTAWSLGLQLQIPYTPHSVSIQVSNAYTTTLQGASSGAGRRWGFEFTVPIRLGRYFGPDAETQSQEPRGREEDVEGSESPLAALVDMTNRLQFSPDTVRIQAGGTVLWRNASALVHTVTADPGRAVRVESVHLPASAQPFHSGEIRPGEEFRHTFAVPGEYRYFCVPHELAGMVGVVIVSVPPPPAARTRAPGVGG
jgi:plastocyanin